MAEISVIVPVFNVEPYLHRCVDSILRQTFEDFELILVDDGSTDRCPVICDQYAAEDSRVRMIHQPNAGLSAARNAGLDWVLASSDSRWISFVDSDDWVHPAFLETLLMAALDHDVLVSCCGFQRISGNMEPEAIRKSITVLKKPEEVYCSADQNGIDAYTWRFLYNKHLFENIHFPVGRIFEDVFTTHKLIFQVPAIASVDQALYYYYYRQDSFSHSPWNRSQMDIVEAFEENLFYFRNTSCANLKRCLVRGYVAAIHSQYLGVLRSNLDFYEKQRIISKLQKKMKTALWKRARDGQLRLQSEGYLYEVAYPGLMKLYWLMESQLKKIKFLINRK